MFLIKRIIILNLINAPVGPGIWILAEFLTNGTFASTQRGNSPHSCSSSRRRVFRAYGNEATRELAASVIGSAGCCSFAACWPLLRRRTEPTPTPAPRRHRRRHHRSPWAPQRSLLPLGPPHSSSILKATEWRDADSIPPRWFVYAVSRRRLFLNYRLKFLLSINEQRLEWSISKYENRYYDT